MARAKKKATRDKRAQRQRELRHWLIDEGVWMVAQTEVYELFTSRKDILHEYDRTEGSTDWVWLEEGLSADLSGTDYYQEASELEKDCMYVASFILAYNTIRTFHPNIRPPVWLLPELALVAGTKEVPEDLASVLRDLFLSGRDAEAMLAIGELREGPFIFWHSGFFRDVDAGTKPHIQAQIPPDTRFVGHGRRGASFHWREVDRNVRVAIGAAMQFFATTNQLAFVGVDTSPNVSNPWHNAIVFAISNDEGDILDIEQENASRGIGPG